MTGSAKIKVYDRDCAERGESLQGDMYIRDAKNTKGHVSPCTYGAWHPSDKCVHGPPFAPACSRIVVPLPSARRPCAAAHRACVTRGLHRDQSTRNQGRLNKQRCAQRAWGIAACRGVPSCLPPAQAPRAQAQQRTPAAGQVAGLLTRLLGPTRRGTALTSSEDGTVRLWDTATVVQKTVVKPTLPKPGRVAVTTARFSRDGALILAGLANGSIQIWDHKGGFRVLGCRVQGSGAPAQGYWDAWNNCG